VKAPYFTRLDEDRYWPVEIRWIRDKLDIRSGTPRYIVAIDRTVVSSTFGTGSWSHTAYPLLQRLVAQKTGG
jgi:hypothetical protein